MNIIHFDPFVLQNLVDYILAEFKLIGDLFKRGQISVAVLDVFGEDLFQVFKDCNLCGGGTRVNSKDEDIFHISGISYVI